MTKQYLYILDINNRILSTGIRVPEIPDPADATKRIADGQWIVDRMADLVNIGISEQIITNRVSDFQIPKYVFDPLAVKSANITERDYVSVIKASQKWKDRKKAQLKGKVRGDFARQEEDKYQTLKAMKADGATLSVPDLAFLTAFETWRTVRLAQYETDKTNNGIT